MKISYMLKREDFYNINEKTLQKYFVKNEGKTSLYIYSHLNAIVTISPAKEVKDYLLCEFSVRSNVIKRLLVATYVKLCLCSRGLLASKKICVDAIVKNNVLIYPCNRKYRIFDFDMRVVDVVIKDGFCNDNLLHEIEFRNRKNLPAFVPNMVSVVEEGYREAIIDGKPLARIEEKYEIYRDDAYKQFLAFALEKGRAVNAKEYARQLANTIGKLAIKKVERKELLSKVVMKLRDFVKEQEEIALCFSHGDLQPGNIWVENGSGKIYIIDWESWGERSVWYDKSTLYYELRMGVEKYLQKEININEKIVVLLEDLVFQLNELNNLPLDFGKEQFDVYLDKLDSWLELI